MKCFVVVAMNATCRRLFVHAFKSSKGGKTVNERAKDERHYLHLLTKSRGKISKMRRFVRGVEVSRKSLMKEEIVFYRSERS